ncbi:MAG: GIY-YIG nuclease family protein [Chlorobiales bacterium]|nr:GIY-YIG nuclease family protein [Chlorobiales bacterium]
MQITCFGNGFRQGTYALFIVLSKELSIAFGKFLGGRKLLLEPGCYIYIGSALGNRSASMPLARRLVRHASRSNGNPPHELRDHMVRFFQKNSLAGPGLQPPSQKKLHWHIDYLLDNQHAQIVRLLIIRSPDRLETALSHLAASLDETSTVAQGLGAGDVRNSTHLLSVSNLDSCFTALERTIPPLINR